MPVQKPASDWKILESQAKNHIKKIKKRKNFIIFYIVFSLKPTQKSISENSMSIDLTF